MGSCPIHRDGAFLLQGLTEPLRLLAERLALLPTFVRLLLARALDGGRLAWADMLGGSGGGMAAAASMAGGSGGSAGGRGNTSSPGAADESPGPAGSHASDAAGTAAGGAAAAGDGGSVASADATASSDAACKASRNAANSSARDGPAGEAHAQQGAEPPPADGGQPPQRQPWAPMLQLSAMLYPDTPLQQVGRREALVLAERLAACLEPKYVFLVGRFSPIRMVPTYCRPAWRACHWRQLVR